MDVGSWASAAESEDEEGVAAHGSEDADADADGVASDGGASDGGGGAGSASVPNRTRAGRRAGRAGRHAHRAFRAATMASESVAKVLAAHITAKGKRTEALAAYFSERRPTGQKVVKEAFQDAPGDLRIFFLVFAIINALADVIAVERLVLDREDLAENLILAAFAGQALSTVRAAFKGLAPSTDQTCRTCAALEALLVAYLPPRAAKAWGLAHAAWEWPESFEQAFAEAVALMEQRNVIAHLTSTSPILAKRLTTWELSDLLNFLELKGPSWVAEALHASTATELPALKAVLSAKDPGAAGSLLPSSLHAMTAGLCYYCGRGGHRIGECPDRLQGLPPTPPAGARPPTPYSRPGPGASGAGAPYVSGNVHALSQDPLGAERTMVFEEQDWYVRELQARCDALQEALDLQARQAATLRGSQRSEAIMQEATARANGPLHTLAEVPRDRGAFRFVEAPQPAA